MAVNTDFVGRTYPPSGPYAVSAADIAAFAAAVGATDPVHTDAEAARAAGYADVEDNTLMDEVKGHQLPSAMILRIADQNTRQKAIELWKQIPKRGSFSRETISEVGFQPKDFVGERFESLALYWASL